MELVWAYRALPGNLVISWNLEGAFTATGTSDVKEVLSKVQATVKHWVHAYPPLPVLRVTAVDAFLFLICGTSRRQQGMCHSVKRYFFSQ